MESDFQKSNQQQGELASNTHVRGNILLFHAYDIGESIDTEMIKEKKIVPTTDAVFFPHFKNYHIPIFVKPPYNSLVNKGENELAARTDCLYARVHDFGALSFCYKIPFCGTLDTLKVRIIQYVSVYRKVSQKDAKIIFDSILPAIKRPNFFNLKSEYYAVQVNNLMEKFDPEEFRQMFGSKIASLLRLETENLSEFQEQDILQSVTGYYGKDMIIIDSEAAFIYDDEYYEAVEFFELANVQRLELQYFDKTLDQELNYLYKHEKYQISTVSYIPLLGTSLDFFLTRLAKLRLDISVISERLGNSIKMLDDAYYANLYSMLVEKLRLEQWRDSISQKMAILNDLYSVRKDKLDTIREEMLTIVIIIFIGIEAFLR